VFIWQHKRKKQSRSLEVPPFDLALRWGRAPHFARSEFLDKMSEKGKIQLAHASAPLHLFDEFLRFFEPNPSCLSVKLYRLNFSIGT
jgi:hypothetical protein